MYKRQDIYFIVQEKEVELARRLRHLGLASGVIGGRSYPKPTSQPATMSYWTAIRVWGILRPLPDETYPSRAQAHNFLRQHLPLTTLRDDDKQPIEIARPLFITLPDPPNEWRNIKANLDFKLSHDELQFAKQLLIAVNRPDSNERNLPSLLSLLVDSQLAVSDLEFPWSPKIFDILNADEKLVLIRAKRIAALVAIGRAVYAALVEKLRDSDDGLPTNTVYQENLKRVVKDYSTDALQLDVNQIGQDAPHLLGSRVIDILWSTQRWLHADQDVDELLDLYQEVELSRKGRRARLANTLIGQQRRSEWVSEDQPRAYPLSYRWGNVKRMLSDLRDGE